MVKWVKIGDVCTFKRGQTITAKQAVEGSVPVVAGGQKPSYFHDQANREAGCITVAGSGAYAGFVSYWNIPIWVSDAFTVEPDESLNIKYLFYFLKLNQQRIFDTQKGAGVPHVHGKDIENFEIPLPPLSEQQRIVDILDKFEGMVENVEKELLLRQKQYEFYREKMMNCLRCDSVKWVKIGDEGSFYSGLSGKNKNDFVNGNAKFVTYMNVYTNVALNFDIEDKVQIRDTERQNTIEYGDIIFTGSSETPDECGMSCVVTQVPEESIYLNSFCFGYRFNSIEHILPDYCKHLFRSSMIRSAIAKTANGVTRFNVSKKLFANIEIPVPSLSKQQEIVEKLDKFEEMISTLKRELELRKKQYEYYREKLLTFE